jgi:hypothetical protein
MVEYWACRDCAHQFPVRPLVNDSPVGRLLEEISWEGNARPYRRGGRGRENVLTTEVFQLLDWLQRHAFLGAVLNAAHGADEVRSEVADDVEAMTAPTRGSALICSPTLSVAVWQLLPLGRVWPVMACPTTLRCGRTSGSTPDWPASPSPRPASDVVQHGTTWSRASGKVRVFLPGLHRPVWRSGQPMGGCFSNRAGAGAGKPPRHLVCCDARRCAQRQTPLFQ